MSFSHDYEEVPLPPIVASVYDIITYMHVDTQMYNLLQHRFNGTQLKQAVVNNNDTKFTCNKRLRSV